MNHGYHHYSSDGGSDWGNLLGVRMGGIGIDYTGGIGVLIQGLCPDMKPGNIPWDVI